MHAEYENVEPIAGVSTCVGKPPVVQATQPLGVKNATGYPGLAGSSIPTHIAPSRPTSGVATVPLMEIDAGDGSNVVPAQKTLPLTV